MISMGEHLGSMNESLGSIPTIAKKGGGGGGGGGEEGEEEIVRSFYPRVHG
jgi:hypothetical protein